MKTYKSTFFLTSLLLLVSCISVSIGVLDVNLSAMASGNLDQIEILLVSRLPRLLAVLCTGAGMSVAGLIMQQLCRNKFVSPTTSATISSAQLGLLLAILVFPQATLKEKTFFAFTMSIAGTYVFVLFMQRLKCKDIIMVPLVGIMFGNALGGITSFLAYKYNLMQAMNSFLVGDFSLVLKGNYEIVFLILPLLVIAFSFANHFNIVGLGEDFAKNLGVPYTVVLFGGLSIAALITASVVVTIGTIPYLGLVVPNLITILKGDKLKNSLIDTALFGALFVLICDIVGRLVIFPYEIPVNLIVGVIGSVVFLGIIFWKLSSHVPSVHTRSAQTTTKGGCGCDQ
ncbi:MAG: iron chelate uptake ABC transporter family permease subunit [Oscillospiraceae bacterium]|nr:iron chelate uptake ABC transporter family permease subunit [Oscillospiraceae bacterium]